MVNRYPYDQVVSFVLRYFGAAPRTEIRILDYGCGGGNHCAFFEREGFDWYGIDFSASAINHARQLVSTVSSNFDMRRLVCADFAAMPFPEDHFDAVVDRQALDQNMVREIPRLVAEIYRVLKPGGFYFGINFSDRHPTLIHGRSLGAGDYDNFIKGPLKQAGARHFFSRHEIFSLFSSFSIVDLQVLTLQSLIKEGSGSEEFIVIAKKPHIQTQVFREFSQ